MAIYESLFDNETVALKATTQLRALPRFVDNNWRPRQPHTWRDPSQCCFIAHDTENKEFDFENGGPGWSRGQVKSIGHALTLYWPDSTSDSLYLPTGHEVDAHLNLDEGKVVNYVKACLQATPRIPKGYANAIYDVGTATEQGIYVQGVLHDVQYAEALLSEDENVNLDALAKKYLGQSKTTNQLYEWCASAYGGEANGGQRANLYRASPILVGPYAEQDSALIRPILWRQYQQLEIEQMTQLYTMECKLIRILIRMRMRGVAIDLPYLDILNNEVMQTLREKIASFHALTGVHTSDSCPTGDIAKAFDSVGIPYRITDVTKKPSITAEDLKLIAHPIAQLSLEIRQLGKIKSQFIESTLMQKHVNGVVHCSFDPLRGESHGTRSGRFSSSYPNLQNIPVRTELGKKIRKAFIPFAGHLCWQKDDFSQYEYRLLANCAVDRIGGPNHAPVFGPGPTSNALRQRYIDDPNTDYHTSTQDMIKAKTGKEIARKPTKTINFGLMNLMGIELLALNLSLPTKEVKGLLEAYHEANPYVKATAKYYEQMAQTQGYIATTLGRRSRFNLWEPRPKWDDEKKEYAKSPGLRYSHALAVYGPNIQRARAHTALNRKTQGDNADGVKMAMVLGDEAGVFAVTGDPTITVHDEFDYSVIDDTLERRQAHEYMRHECMEKALPLVKIPIRVDTGRGLNWGSIE